MDNVNFYSLTEDRYHQLESKDENAFYKTEQCLYQGSTPISRQTWGILEEPTIPVDPIPDTPKVLNDYSWAEINAISDAGNASSIFKVGDSKPFTGQDGITYNMRIMDFNRFTKSDGSGRAGILFKSDEISKTIITTNQLSGSASGDGITKAYNYYTYQNLNSLYFDILPEDLQQYVKEVYHKYAFHSYKGKVLNCNWYSQLGTTKILDTGVTDNDDLDGKKHGTVGQYKDSISMIESKTKMVMPTYSMLFSDNVEDRLSYCKSWTSTSDLLCKSGNTSANGAYLLNDTCYNDDVFYGYVDTDGSIVRCWDSSVRADGYYNTYALVMFNI